MVGKRQHPIRRTVSASFMGSESNISQSCPLPNYLKENQKAPPGVSSCSPRPMLAPNNLGILEPPLAEVDAAITTPSQASPLFHKFEEATSNFPNPEWADRVERKSVKLGVHAALLEGICAATGTGAKDDKDKAPPPVVLQNTVMPHFAQQYVLPSPPQHNNDRPKRSVNFLHESPGTDDYDDLVSMEVHTLNFLEACYLCKRRLSHGLDIYMYRGDQAFCSEQCRYEQMLSDEHKEKYSLLAIQMTTFAHPLQSSDQQSRPMTSSTTTTG